MLSHGNLLMYLNMGGEMLYVLRQRLKAQHVKREKAIKVLDDVTIGLLDPNKLGIVTQSSELLRLTWLHSIMESIALCSIMKLDNDSMNKLFDLMTMMVKYQLTAATGPREIVLITMNHIDSLREIITTTSAHQCVTLIHQMVIDVRNKLINCNVLLCLLIGRLQKPISYYGKLTYNEIWQARNNCLNELSGVNVRVSILLKLGIQNEDTTFNIGVRNYNEKFIERQSELGDLKLLENTCRGCNVGSLQLFGDRVTMLGRNIYSVDYGNVSKVTKHLSTNRVEFFRDRGMKAELGMLAVQLGTDEETTIASRPFSLNLLMDDVSSNTNDNIDANENSTTQLEDEVENLNKERSNEDYREKLNNVCADFVETDVVERKINLLQLLDEVE